MNFRLLFDPFVSWPLLWACCAIAAALAIYLIYLRRRGWYYRVLSLALVIAALANPLLTSEERQPLSDILAVIIDDSYSQNIGERRAQAENALAELEKSIAALGNTELRIGRIVTGTTPDTDGTRVFTALDRTIESIPPDRYAGAFVITDGQVHDVPKIPSGLAKGTPLHALLTGTKNEADRRVVVTNAPRFAITGNEQTVSFRVEDQPAASQTASVSIRLPNGEEQKFEMPVNTDQTIQVPIEHAGQNLLQIEVAPRNNEVSLTNNKALIVIKGIRDRLRVLLVSGEPHPGERTWRNLLKSDAAVDLVHFTILRPPEKQDGTLTKELSLIAFPTRELFLDKIKSFDLVIFDRYRMQSILPDAYLANVAQYVRDGGAVLIASGPDLASMDGLYSTALSEIMPAAPNGDITEEPFRPVLTDVGMRHPVSQNLPGSNGEKEPKWGRWFRLVNVETAPESEVLMTGPGDLPLLVMNRVGEGRVAQFLSDHGWLWARGYDGGGPQIELLRRIAHWSMKEPDLEEEALSLRQDGQNVIVERRTLAENADDVTISGPSGEQQKVQLSETSPGLFIGRAAFKQPGLYQANDGKLTSLAAIGNLDEKEAVDVRATPEKLAPVITATKGGAFWIEDGLPRLSKASANSLMAGQSWAAIRENNQYRVTAVREVPLFATLASLAVLLLAVTGMWYREGR
jgi:hypothetical protein